MVLLCKYLTSMALVCKESTAPPKEKFNLQICKMKKLILAAFVALATTVAMAQIPSVKVENGKGKSIKTSSLVDGETPMILSFWAVSCSNCILELNAISEKYPDWLEEADFRVVAVSVDDAKNSAKARALAEGNGWGDFTLLYDKNQDFQRAMNAPVLPHVFVVDKTGKIVYSHTAYQPGGEDELFNIIKGLK